MKVLVDMNLSPRWVGFLADAGVEAIHWSEVGPTDASDDEVVGWAAHRGYVVLTADLDFGAILAATQRRGPSVLLLRSENLTPSAVGNAVLAAIHQAGHELADGAILSIDASRARLRILPLA